MSDTDEQISKSLIDRIPGNNTVIKGSVGAAGVGAVALALVEFVLPKIMEQQEEVQAISLDVDAVEETLDSHREDYLSRAIRNDKREYYDVINRMEAEGTNTDLVEQRIVIEEQIKEMETEREMLRTKKKKGDD